MMIRKIIIIIACLLLLTFLGLIVLGWYWGIFSTVQLRLQSKDQSYLRTVDGYFSYSELLSNSDSIRAKYNIANAPCEEPVTILFDNPLSEAPINIRAKRGCLIDTFALNDSAGREDLLNQSGKFIVGSLHAHIQIAVYKTYPAISEWIMNNEFEADTSRRIIEIHPLPNQIEVWYPIRTQNLIEE